MQIFRWADHRGIHHHADAFALAFQVPFVTFELAENGLIRVRAGQVPVPDAYGHPGRLQTSQAVNNRPLLQQTMSIDDVPQGVLMAAQQILPRARVEPVVTNVYARELELLKAVPMAR